MKRLHTEELHDLCRSSNTVRRLKLGDQDIPYMSISDEGDKKSTNSLCGETS